MAVTASVLLNRLLAGARLKHLQVLVTVAELGSFKKTAEAIGMTQPAITHIVSDLEALLEVELFQRHARGVSPSPFCEELVPMARQVITSMGMGMEAVVARMERGRATVRLGATMAAIAGLLVRAVPAFMEEHPQISLDVVERRPEELDWMVQRSQVDLVMYRRPAVLPAGWGFMPLMADQLVVVCSKDHPLAKRRRVRFQQLSRETWLPAPVSTLGRRMLDALMLKWDFTPRYAQVATIALPLTWALLANTRLLTLIPFSVLSPYIEAGQLAVVAVDELMPIEPIGMLAPLEPLSPAARTVVAFLSHFQRPTLDPMSP